MNEPLRHISESAATTVTVAKIGTTGSSIATVGASFAGENTIAVMGLVATVIFGLMGVIVNYYFRHKENKRRDEEHAMHKAEHEATMARLTAK